LQRGFPLSRHFSTQQDCIKINLLAAAAAFGDLLIEVVSKKLVEGPELLGNDRFLLLLLRLRSRRAQSLSGQLGGSRLERGADEIRVVAWASLLRHVEIELADGRKLNSWKKMMGVVCGVRGPLHR
jgi:hypothetical protein